MKFFNWVHKRFHHHHPLPKDECAQMVERTSGATSYHEKEIMEIQVNSNYDKALLKKAVLVDALDGWKDGILAIGTFGFDPKEYLVLESRDHDEDGDVEDDQITPDFSLSGSDTEDHDSTDDCTDSEGEEENPLMTQGHCLKKAKDDVMCHHEIVDSADEYHDDDDDDDSYYKKKVGRTTLADLFLADADGNNNNKKMMNKFGSAAKLFGDEEDLSKCDKKKYNLLNTKKGLSFAKKLIPKVKEDTSPIKNVQQLMRRMLKRKIHPELLDVKAQKSTVGIELVSNAAPEKAASEYVCLLAMQGVPSEV